MTCIVGVTTRDGGVVMGGDSAGVSNYHLTVRGDPKVFARGDVVIGYTTSFRMGQLLKDKTDDRVLSRARRPIEIVDHVREVLRAGGWLEKEKEREASGVFMVGWRGRILKFHADLQYGWRREWFDATGCGEPYALGYLRAMTEGWRSKPTVSKARDLVRRTLRCAEHFSAGVCGPFKIVVGGKASQ